MIQDANRPPPARDRRLRELALLFLKLGTTAFGGPAAHVAMMEEEVVRRRGWLSREEFLDLLGAANLIPGPNSTELAIHIGHRRAGWAGLLVAGSCFILPAMVLVLAIAWLYVRFGRLPVTEAILYGVKPVIIAVVVRALVGLARTAVKGPVLAGVTALAILAAAMGMNELLVLGVAGLGTMVLAQARRSQEGGALGWAVPAQGAWLGAGLGATAAAPGLVGIFLFFAKIGAVLYGSGYVLLAFLRADLVERWHWLTQSQLLDAVAVGQFTPGPVFTTATFIGFVLAGWKGGLVATVGIFLPAFAFVALSGPLVPRLRKSAAAGAFLDGVNAASLALMAVVSWQLGRAAVVDLATLVLAVASLAILLRFKLNSAWLVLGGGVVGWLVRAL